MSAPIDQSEFWNASAASKEFTHPLDHSKFSQFISADVGILDYGCAHGRLCSELTQLGFCDVHGVDYSEEMVRIAKARYPALSFSVVDGLTLPYPEASFGAVLLVAVLTCIPSDDAQRALLAELSRVLRPGGLLFVSDYPLQGDERNQKRYELHANEFGCYGTFRLPGGGVVRHHRETWFTELLADYTIEEAENVDGRTMNGNPARIRQLWARRNNKCE